MNELYAVKTSTPVGSFWIIIKHIYGHDTAIVSGFGKLATVVKLLPVELQLTSPRVVPEHPYQKLVIAYFKGDKKALEKIPRHQKGSTFAEKIWQSIEKVAYGTTISYRQLATLAGKPNAVRAAGTACSLNKLVLLVPCHRIVRSNGQLGEYLYGAKIKEHLLKIEDAL